MVMGILAPLVSCSVTPGGSSTWLTCRPLADSERNRELGASLPASGPTATATHSTDSASGKVDAVLGRKLVAACVKTRDNLGYRDPERRSTDSDYTSRDKTTNYGARRETAGNYYAASNAPYESLSKTSDCRPSVRSKRIH
jgi:hypothetical protein